MAAAYTTRAGDAAPVIVIAGATGTGKSALALDLAERLDGEIINADASQVYAPLRILTARPSPEDHQRVPHVLYGEIDDGRVVSAADWRAWALDAIRAAYGRGRRPIVVGGTGLYLKALLVGLAPIPPVPWVHRAAARELVAREGAPAVHARLRREDPDMAARLAPRDSQRVTRAWEVLRATGRSLAEWQALPAEPPPGDLAFAVLRLMPARQGLREALGQRFAKMVAAGALDEVAALRARTDFPDDHPLRRAVGAPELAQYLAGDRSLDSAIDGGATSTRQYAKRQMTWLRHQLPEDPAAPRHPGWPVHSHPGRYERGLADWALAALAGRA